MNTIFRIETNACVRFAMKQRMNNAMFIFSFFVCLTFTIITWPLTVINNSSANKYTLRIKKKKKHENLITIMDCSSMSHICVGFSSNC